jgi:flagellar FliJ protein
VLKFRFRFERLIEVKEKLVEHKQQEMERTAAEAAALAQKAADISKEISGRYDEMSSRCVTGEEFSMLLGSVLYLDVQKAATLKEKANREARVDALRAELIGLMVELKVFEKLKIRAFRAAKKVLARKEQKLMDDLAARASGPQSPGALQP